MPRSRRSARCRRPTRPPRSPRCSSGTASARTAGAVRLLLAVDLGKTRCRAALLPLEGGEALATGSAPGAPGLADPRGVAAALAAIRAATRAGGADAEVVVVGAAGALAAPE